MITRENQSLLDVAIQMAGTIEAVFELAMQNDMAITDGFEPGTVLATSELPENAEVLEYYRKNVIVPATVDDPKMWQGIGYWKIGKDFIVS